ncbi:hypothetical protein [Pseudomonas phage vB_PseuGesM_254]|uniref:Uncharacterized protein n=1 Tax=Pseudomonas phage vB_PseuGesM_254 TaxID=3092638 RepID=A0AAX4G6P0_9CAUD|nr:hypothetical protein [Pseudomonas phage PseuGes_254]
MQQDEWKEPTRNDFTLPIFLQELQNRCRMRDKTATLQVLEVIPGFEYLILVHSSNGIEGYTLDLMHASYYNTYGTL